MSSIRTYNVQLFGGIHLIAHLCFRVNILRRQNHMNGIDVRQPTRMQQPLLLDIGCSRPSIFFKRVDHLFKNQTEVCTKLLGMFGLFPRGAIHSRPWHHLASQFVAACQGCLSRRQSPILNAPNALASRRFSFLHRKGRSLCRIHGALPLSERGKELNSGTAQRNSRGVYGCGCLPQMTSSGSKKPPRLMRSPTLNAPNALTSRRFSFLHRKGRSLCRIHGALPLSERGKELNSGTAQRNSRGVYGCGCLPQMTSSGSKKSPITLNLGGAKTYADSVPPTDASLASPKIG